MRKLNALLLCFLLCLSACKKQDEPSGSSEPLIGEEVYLNLETDISLAAPNGEKLRALGNVGLVVSGGDNRDVRLGIDNNGSTLPAIIVIKNKPAGGNPAQTYYVTATFQRKGGYHYHSLNLRLDKDVYGNRIKLNRQDTWYLMSLLNGRFDQATKKMMFDPYYKRNRDNCYEALMEQWLDRTECPLLISWKRFELRPTSTGNLEFVPAAGSNLSAVVKGTILRANIYNRASGKRRLGQMRFVSNVLDPRSGAYDLSNLPVLPQGDEAGVHPTWVPDNTMPAGGYDMRWRKWKSGPFDMGSGDRFDAQPNDLYKRSFIIWAMPVNAPTGETPKTELYGRTVHYNQADMLLWSTASTPVHDIVLQFNGEITK